MRQRSIGILVVLMVVCLPRPNHANDKPIAGVTVYVLVPGGTGTEVERVSVQGHPETTDAGG